MSTKHIEPIVVDGYTFPMHSDYFFDLKKTYKESPTRSIDGSINSFPVKFFVPYFKVSYAVLKVDEYQQMMSKLQTDEQTVRFYDSFAKEYRTAKFYAQQPTYNQLYGMKANYHYVMDLEIIFSGTLNGETKASLTYDLNGLSGTVPTALTDKNVGDEFVADIGSGITGIKKWNTSPDGTGINYTLGGNYALTIPNMTLYAIG